MKIIFITLKTTIKKHQAIVICEILRHNVFLLINVTLENCIYLVHLSCLSSNHTIAQPRLNLIKDPTNMLGALLI